MPRRASSHAIVVPAMPPPTTTTSVPVISLVFRIWNDRATSGTPSPRNVRALRAARGLSLGELATASGTGKATLSRIEAGQANPTVETLFALADALGVPFGALTADRAAAVQHVRAADLPRVGGGVSRHACSRRSPAARSSRRSRSSSRAGQVRASASPHPPGVIEHLAADRAAGCARARSAATRRAGHAATSCASPATSPHEYAALDGEARTRDRADGLPVRRRASGWT